MPVNLMMIFEHIGYHTVHPLHTLMVISGVIEASGKDAAHRPEHYVRILLGPKPNGGVCPASHVGVT